MQIVQTITTSEPRNAALATGAILAADKGYANEVKPHAGGWIMIAENGKAILFQSKASNGTHDVTA